VLALLGTQFRCCQALLQPKQPFLEGNLQVVGEFMIEI